MQARVHSQNQQQLSKHLCVLFFFRNIQLLHRDLFTGVFLRHIVSSTISHSVGKDGENVIK